MRPSLSRIGVPICAKALSTVSLSLALLLLCLPLFSQSYTGRILGTVTDKSGAVISGATVVVTDVQRGVARTLTTDQAGEYVAPDLQPGIYKVHFSAKGFKTVERVNVPLEVAKDLRIDVALQPGEISQTIEVLEEVPLVDTTSSTLGGTLSNKEINDLPLNGRNYENLLQLRPGVMRYPGGGFSTTSANGLRAEDNAYLIDGLFNSEPFSGQSIINGAGIAGDSATILPVDSIQEFNLQQNPPAEYGWKPGAIVNVGLKSGTNTLHGTGYAFGRDTPLDARNYFNVTNTPKQPRNLEQFGGTVGGPIIKDKLFFFGGYEGQRYEVGNITQLSTPATVTLGGDPANSLVDAITALQAANIPVSNVSLQIGGCTLGPPVACNGTGFPTNPGTNPTDPTLITFGLPNSVTVDNAVGKVDYHKGDRHTISGMYFFGNNSGTVSDASQLQKKWLTQIHTRAQVLGLNWAWTPSSRWVNEARFGYNRLYQPTFTADHNVPASSYGINTGVTNPLYGGLPRINIAPFYIFPQELGGFNWPKVQGPDTRFQFVDHIAYTVGKHALKFGGEIHRDGFNGGAYGGVRGRIKFGFGVNDVFPGATSLEDFFAGVPDKGSQLIGDPTRHIHNWGYAAFVQDDWRASRNLTVNLGLRYELSTVIKDDHNLLGNFDPTLGLLQVGRGLSSPYNTDHTNFAPRLGFAWDVTGRGKTVLRGGGGIIYETVNWESFLALNNSMGLSTIPTGAIIDASGNTAGGSIAVGTVNFPASSLNWDPAITGVQGSVFPTTPLDCSAAPCSILGVARNLKTPYVWNWSLNVQHAFTNNLSLEIGYVGSHGSKLVGIHDINQPPPGSGWTGGPGGTIAQCLASAPAWDNCAADGDAEQAARPFNPNFPYLANIYQMGNIYRSNYNGLQTTLTSRNFHGFSAVVGYTYSHSLDDVGANWDFGAGSGIPQNNVRPQTEYASSDFDIRHRFTLAMTYLIPGKKSFAQLLDGWQLNSIVSLYGAQPWGPMDATTDVTGTGEVLSDRWDFFGNPRDFKSGPVGIPYFPNNSNPSCAARALAVDGGNPTGPADVALGAFGCYAMGNAVMIPPPFTLGSMGRNTFRDTGFRNWDLSVAKNWKFGERLGAQFRAEFFNVLNHPNFANPFGGQNGWAHNDPGGPGNFGCACATPDVAASNPVIGSGGSRAVQLGLKLLF
jgi:Carboxypeptidase regulatory-like domain